MEGKVQKKLKQRVTKLKHPKLQKCLASCYFGFRYDNKDFYGVITNLSRPNPKIKLYRYRKGTSTEVKDAEVE